MSYPNDKWHSFSSAHSPLCEITQQYKAFQCWPFVLETLYQSATNALQIQLWKKNAIKHLQKKKPHFKVAVLW